jgi:hypothetical protein
MIPCQSCGRPNAEDARFCFSCGNALSRGPPVKVEVKSPLTGQILGPQMASPMPPFPGPPIQTPRQIQSPGSCYYHHDLPAAFVCARCGRSICSGCNKPYGALSFCTECYYNLSNKLGQTQYPQYPQYPAYPQPEQGQSFWPF